MRSQRLLCWVLGCFMLAACETPKPVTPTPLGDEVCTNGVDDNGDGKIDCLDPKCIDTSACTFGEICSNNRDDNGNRLIDCEDPQCEGQECGANCLCVGGSKQVFSSKDGGLDAGAKADAGASGDSGVKADAGPPTDAGRVDAGSPTDAGKPDAGSPADSGAPVDSGTPGVDAGGPVDAGNPCNGCGTGCTCTGGVKTETACGDLGDNDSDLATDCNDTDCLGKSCGNGCTCAANHKTEIACNDSTDNNGDGNTDCADPDCANQSCGAGCSCVSSVKKEMNCGDTVDNDGDGQTDCADSDCPPGTGVEVCDDGVDNTCDHAIDCGDGKCAASIACSLLNDGLPCTADSQCAGGKCLTEAGAGYPNGYCTNASACTVGTPSGCHAGFCVQNNDGTTGCRAACVGTGLGGSGGCRVGYACDDADSVPGNNNNFCRPLCSTNTECAGASGSFGCNLTSRLCENTSKGLLPYGSACSANSQCEGSLCLTDAQHPFGECSGTCLSAARDCNTGGYCDVVPDAGDNVSVCLKKCDNFGQCRSADRYGCFYYAYQQYAACQCLRSGFGTVSPDGGSWASLCCSGSSSGNACN